MASQKKSGGRVAYNAKGSRVENEAKGKKSGGAVGRKSGGRVGADKSPFSSAANGMPKCGPRS